MWRKTQRQEIFKKYTGIFAISTKSVIRHDVYRMDRMDNNIMVLIL
jgi:hypothetical protein